MTTNIREYIDLSMDTMAVESPSPEAFIAKQTNWDLPLVSPALVVVEASRAFIKFNVSPKSFHALGLDKSQYTVEYIRQFSWASGRSCLPTKYASVKVYLQKGLAD
jgi:hypothetical protein